MALQAGIHNKYIIHAPTFSNASVGIFTAPYTWVFCHATNRHYNFTHLLMPIGHVTIINTKVPLLHCIYSACSNPIEWSSKHQTALVCSLIDCAIASTITDIYEPIHSCMNSSLHLSQVQQFFCDNPNIFFLA